MNITSNTETGALAAAIPTHGEPYYIITSADDWLLVLARQIARGGELNGNVPDGLSSIGEQVLEAFSAGRPIDYQQFCSLICAHQTASLVRYAAGTGVSDEECGLLIGTEWRDGDWVWSPLQIERYPDQANGTNDLSQSEATGSITAVVK